nr:hypothetical protein [Tanacetum cinerariifolium]
MKMNTTSSLSSRTLPGNIITNPKEDLKGIISHSGTAYQGPTIPTTSSSLPKVVELKTLLTNKDKMSELARTPLNEHCSAVLLKKLLEKLGDPGKYSANYNDMTANRIDVIDMACEEYLQEGLSFSDVIASGNPTPYYDPIVSTTSLTLTPFGESDFLLEEVDAFLALEDDPTLSEVDQSYVDTEGDILLLEAFLNNDPSLPPLNQGNYLPQVRKEHKICEAKTDKSLSNGPLEVELKDFPLHLEYAFWKVTISCKS